MKVVAESIETIRVPLSAQQGGLFVDPSTAGARAVTVALKIQGTYPGGGDYTITGTWEQNLNTNPPSYWIAFITPGSLVRGKNYQGYAKLAAVGGETPIVPFGALIEAI